MSAGSHEFTHETLEQTAPYKLAIKAMHVQLHAQWSTQLGCELQVSDCASGRVRLGPSAEAIAAGRKCLAVALPLEVEQFLVWPPAQDA